MNPVNHTPDKKKPERKDTFREHIPGKNSDAEKAEALKERSIKGGKEVQAAGDQVKQLNAQTKKELLQKFRKELAEMKQFLAKLQGKMGELVSAKSQSRGSPNEPGSAGASSPQSTFNAGGVRGSGPQEARHEDSTEASSQLKRGVGNPFSPNKPVTREPDRDYGDGQPIEGPKKQKEKDLEEERKNESW